MIERRSFAGCFEAGKFTKRMGLSTFAKLWAREGAVATFPGGRDDVTVETSLEHPGRREGHYFQRVLKMAHSFVGKAPIKLPRGQAGSMTAGVEHVMRPAH